MVTFVVRGSVVDSQTGDALGGVPIDVRLLKGGEFIGFVVDPASLETSLKTPLPPITAPDGSFALAITNGERVGGIACPAPVPGTFEKVAPDQIRVSVSRAGCRQEVFINVNGDTIVDVSFPENLIELMDPVPAPPCEE